MHVGTLLDGRSLHKGKKDLVYSVYSDCLIRYNNVK